MTKEQSNQCVVYINKNGQHEYATANGDKELAKISNQLNKAGFNIVGIRDLNTALRLCENDLRQQRFD